jgi:hypothetical protein
VITRQAFDFSRYPRSHHLIEPIAEIMREATTSGDFWVAGTASSEQNQKNVFGVTSFMNIGVGSIFRADKLAGAMLKVLRSATSEERATTLRPWCEVLIERMRSGQCTADEEDDLEALFMDTPKFAEQWRQAVGKTVGIYWWRRLSRRRYRRRRLDAFERLLASARTITT